MQLAILTLIAVSDRRSAPRFVQFPVSPSFGQNRRDRAASPDFQVLCSTLPNCCGLLPHKTRHGCFHSEHAHVNIGTARKETTHVYVLLLGRLLLEGLEAGLFSVSYDACSCGLRRGCHNRFGHNERSEQQWWWCKSFGIYLGDFLDTSRRISKCSRICGIDKFHAIARFGLPDYSNRTWHN